MKTFKVTLDRGRNLKLTNRALRDMEIGFGSEEKPKTIFDILNLEAGMRLEDINIRALSSMLSITIVSKLIYYSLEDRGNLTPDEVLDLIPQGRMLEIGGICLKMLFDAYGLSDALDESEQKGKVGGVGRKQRRSPSVRLS